MLYGHSLLVFRSIPHGAKGSCNIIQKCMKNANCVFDKYIDNIMVQSYHRDVIFNHELGPNTSKWLEKLHFNPVSILPYRTVLENTHLFQVGGSGSTYSFVSVCFPKHYFWHIIKGKLGSNVGQPWILTGDTRVSHTSPLGSCGTPCITSEYSWLSHILTWFSFILNFSAIN